MKQFLKSKRILSFVLSIAIIAGTFVGLSFREVVSAGEAVYITKTVVDDIYNNGTTIAHKMTDAAGGDYKFLMSVGQPGSTAMIPAGKYYMTPFVHLADGSTREDKPQAYTIWKSDFDIETFMVETANARSDAMNSYEQFARFYSFYSSPDGEAWTELPFTVGDFSTDEMGSSFISYKLHMNEIPEGTRYVKFLSLTTNANKSIAYKYGIIRASYTYKEKLDAPVVVAKAKNYYGEYANVLSEGARIRRAVRITVSDVTDPFVEGKVVIKLNGTEEVAADYYDASTDAYYFTESGDYSFYAENVAGSSSISFNLKKTTEETVVTKTVVDDIYNTGKTTAIQRTNASGDDYLYKMALEQPNASANALPRGKYYMFPYVHLAADSTKEDVPQAYAVWYIPEGFKSFTVETANQRTAVQTDANFHKKWYSFYYSSDGLNWMPADFVVGDSTTRGMGRSFISYKLTVSEIPDGAKYMKWMSLTTNASKGSAWTMGIIRASYETYVLNPKISVSMKDVDGNYSSPLGNGTTAHTAVQVVFQDVDTSLGDVISIKKDGGAITLPEDGILTEDGAYEITATTVKGTAAISFTIAKQDLATGKETYVFSEGYGPAVDDYQRLLSILPESAPEDFTSGDGHVIVNNTAVVSNQDKGWWGLTEGGTKLTIGSDAKGYKKDGYFYFSNVGEDGTKYTGFSITYTVAVQSGYPTDASFSIYTADRFDGNYRLVEPTQVVEVPISNKAAAVKRYCATYYLGQEGSVVKVKFNPKAPSTTLWQGSFLSILELSKLSLPLIVAQNSQEVMVDNSVSSEAVKLSSFNAEYCFVQKDGIDYPIPDDGVLTEDGYYTVIACNSTGAANVKFYIAKELPVVQLIDKSGNFLNSGAIDVDDVKIKVYNCNEAEILKDNLLYSTETELTVDLNGVYSIFAENDKGYYETTVTVARPLPTLKAFDFRSKAITEGATSETRVTISLETADSYTVTLNGQPYTAEEEFKLTGEGDYTVVATNKAGSVTLNFTIKYNPPLPEYTHAGDTVKVIDYEVGDAYLTNIYSTDMILDKGTALQTDWTGNKGPILRPDVKGEGNEAYAIFKAANFKSFLMYVGYIPRTGFTPEEAFKLYASSNGTDYTELETTFENDISYITTGYKKYRIVAQNIPEGTKYIKLVVDMNKASAAWDRYLKRVELSYNKADYGKLDVDDLKFMVNDAEEGGIINTEILVADSIVVPKSFFEALEGSDKTVNFKLVDENGNLLYTVFFNGLAMDAPMDFDIAVSGAENAVSKALKSLDSEIVPFTLKQTGEWTMTPTVKIKLKRGITYGVYAYKDGKCVYLTDVKSDGSGYVQIELEEYAEYAISGETKLIKEPEEEDDGDSSDNDSATLGGEEATESNGVGNYMMVLNRRKFIPADSPVLMIVIISAAALLLIAAAVVVTIILIKKKKALIPVTPVAATEETEAPTEENSEE